MELIVILVGSVVVGVGVLPRLGFHRLGGAFLAVGLWVVVSQLPGDLWVQFAPWSWRKDMPVFPWTGESWAAWLILAGYWAVRSGRAIARLGADDGKRLTLPRPVMALDWRLKQAFRAGAKKVFLGMSAWSRPVHLDRSARAGHMQIVGPTRCGKSQLLLSLAAQDMAARMPVFFMEAKGDRSDFNQFMGLAALAGRGGDVRYFNPQDPRSMTFNPLRIVEGQDSTALSNQIARAIGREPSQTGEGQDYYRAVDYAKIQSMTEVFFGTGREFTLKDCFLYFDNEAAREKAFDLCPDKALVDSARTGMERNEDSSALTSALKPWVSGRLGELLNTYAPDIALEEVFSGAQLAYFAVPIGYLQVLANPLGKMILAGLMSVSASRQRAAEKPAPASVFLDEFAEFATPVFGSFISTVGSSNLWATLAHQDLGQLQKVQGTSPEAFASTVFNNTSGCKVVFRAPDPEDAEFWAAAVGTFTTYADTERIETGGFWGDKGTGQVSRREVERFRVHPNLLKQLAKGTALAFSATDGARLVQTGRVYPILADQGPSDLPRIERKPSQGLDLAEAAPQGEGEQKWNAEGVVA